MRLRSDGLWEADTFEEHMHPGVEWLENPEFAAAFRELTKEDFMDFGSALSALKGGHRLARAGWNGKGMFIFLVPGSRFAVKGKPLLGIYPEGTEIDYHAHIDIKVAEGWVVPWTASQADMLAEDWEYVNVLEATPEPDGSE